MTVREPPFYFPPLSCRKSQCRLALVSAWPGDVVSPAADRDSGCVRLLHVLRRREPSLEDEGVLAALDTGLVFDRLQELETRHVRWAINLEIEA